MDVEIDHKDVTRFRVKELLGLFFILEYGYKFGTFVTCETSFNGSAVNYQLSNRHSTEPVTNFLLHRDIHSTHPVVFQFELETKLCNIYDRTPSEMRERECRRQAKGFVNEERDALLGGYPKPRRLQHLAVQLF